MRWRYSPAGVSGDGYRRGFSWVAERPGILRAQLAMVGPERRAAIRDTLHRSTRSIARSAYQVAHKHAARRWATRYLLRMIWTGGSARLILPYLAAVWTPAWMLTAGASLARRRRPR